MPLFSVVISLYNKELFIQDTLNSVLDQTFDDFEIVIINDGSTDKSEAIVQSFSNPKIKYFKTENKGASRARNLGIEKATGAFIAFLDGDDLWTPDHLRELNHLILTYPNAGIYASRYELIFKNKTKYRPEFKGITTNYTGFVADYFEASLHYAIATSSSIAVPKKVFETVGNFNPNISSGQDNDLWIRIALKYPVAIGNKVTASYLHFIENSLSKTSILKKKIKDFDFYKEEEKQNPSLKKYLDLYRMEYALQYKMAGEKKTAQTLFKQINPKNIRPKTKFLYYFPTSLLLLLKRFKIFLRNNGIDFSIYQ